MADSDRSRSPMPGRNRSEPRGQAQPARQDLPFFPLWCGPMQAAILHSQNMPHPQFRPQWALSQSGPYMMGRMTNQTPSMTQGTWSGHRFPPAPPSSPPPTLPYPVPSRPATPPCSPTLPCPPTQPCSPSTPGSVPSSQPRPFETPQSTPPGGPEYHDATRTYGFDLNPGSAPAALASLLFDPPEPQTIGKTQCFATFLPFRASASSFFWLFLFSDLLSSNLSLLSASALLCFSSDHIVGSLTSKLPLIRMILSLRIFMIDYHGHYPLLTPGQTVNKRWLPRVRWAVSSSPSVVLFDRLYWHWLT